MEEVGVISARTIVLNRKAINLSIVVFLSIRVSHHSKDWIDRFQNIKKYTPHRNRTDINKVKVY